MRQAAGKPRPGRRGRHGPGQHPNSEAPGSAPGSKPDANDDLQTLPLPEVEKRLASSPDGLTQAEAQKRLAQYGPNEIEEKKTNSLLKLPPTSGARSRG